MAERVLRSPSPQDHPTSPPPDRAPVAASALSGAPASVRALAESMIDHLRTVPGVRAGYLTGSYGRGTADRFSDVDLLVVGTDPQLLDRVRWAAREVADVVLDKTIGSGPEGVVTIVTEQWLRIDVSCRRVGDRLGFRRSEAVELWSDLGDQPGWSPEASSTRSADPVDLVEELGRMLGLLPVLLGRGDVVTARAGCGLLLGRAIELARGLCGAGGSGAMATRRDLPPRVYAQLRALPAVSDDPASLIAFHVAVWSLALDLLDRFAHERMDEHLATLAAALADAYHRDLSAQLPRPRPVAATPPPS